MVRHDDENGILKPGSFGSRLEKLANGIVGVLDPAATIRNLGEQVDPPRRLGKGAVIRGGHDEKVKRSAAGRLKSQDTFEAALTSKTTRVENETPRKSISKIRIPPCLFCIRISC